MPQDTGIDRHAIQRDPAFRPPIHQPAMIAVKGQPARAVRLRQHPGRPFPGKDLRIGKMPRLDQTGAAIEQAHRLIEQQPLDRPVPGAIVIMFGKEMQPPILAPPAERVREELKVRLLRDPAHRPADAARRDDRRNGLLDEAAPPYVFPSWHRCSHSHAPPAENKRFLSQMVRRSALTGQGSAHQHKRSTFPSFSADMKACCIFL